MKRMTLVMNHETNNSSDDDGGGGGGPAHNSRKYECENCRAEFPNKTTADRHMLFCRTLADIRRGGGGGASLTILHHANDALIPTQREMFILIQ